MKYDIVLCGVGGQGVLSVAAIIAGAAVAEGLQVRQSEVHGMAQRGGEVIAHLRLSSDAVRSDLIPHGGAHMLLSMEPMEALRYVRYLRPDGIIVTATEPYLNIPDYPDLEGILDAIRGFPRSLLVPARELARQAGSARASNVALVGAASRTIPLDPASLEGAIRSRFGGKGESILAVNLDAFARGRSLS